MGREEGRLSPLRGISTDPEGEEQGQGRSDPSGHAFEENNRGGKSDQEIPGRDAALGAEGVVMPVKYHVMVSSREEERFSAYDSDDQADAESYADFCRASMLGAKVKVEKIEWEENNGAQD